MSLSRMSLSKKDLKSNENDPEKKTPLINDLLRIKGVKRVILRPCEVRFIDKINVSCEALQGLIKIFATISIKI